jgi:hypothetical protein
MLTWVAERRLDEHVESGEREREIWPVPGLSRYSWTYNSKSYTVGNVVEDDILTRL